MLKIRLAAPLLMCLMSMCDLTGAILATPNESGVAWGHFHFNARDLENARKFWLAVGATQGKPVGGNECFEVKNSLVLVRKFEVTGGSEATIVNHVGFRVKDLDGTLARVKEAGFRILTPAETTAKSHKANVMGPDELNVELVGDPALDAPIASHHVHFYDTTLEETRAWYVKTFGAVPGKRDAFQAADVPGINLSFSAAKGPVKATRGSAVDHIGFEVKNLEAFCKKLEAAGMKLDRPYTKVPQLGIAIAFLTDPWGTYIELTEGLDPVK